MSFADRLKALMAEKGIDQSELARQLGITSQAVNQWTGGDTQPRGHRLAKLAEVLGTTVGWLAGDPAPVESAGALHPADRQMVRSGAISKGIQVPELAVRPSAGGGSDGIELDGNGTHPVVAHWTMPAAYLRAHVQDPSAVRIVTVTGDSMEPEYPADEKVWVDTSHRIPSPPGVYVLWDGFGLVLKRLEIVPGSNPPRVRLLSSNPAYSAYEVPVEDLHINGRVIGKWTWK